MTQFSTRYHEDVVSITEAYNQAVEGYTDRLESVRVTDLFQEFGGDTLGLGHMARAMAGISETGKLPAAKSPARAEYDHARKNIRRWIAKENRTGNSKEWRSPDQKAMSRLKELQAQKELKKKPPENITISFSGDVVYDDEEPSHRNFTLTLPKNGATTRQFIEHMMNGNTHEAYQDIFQAYNIGRDIVIATDDNPDISIDFES